MLTAEMMKILNDTSSSGARRRRAVKKDPNARWKNGIVHYVIEKRFSKFSFHCILILYTSSRI